MEITSTIDQTLVLFAIKTLPISWNRRMLTIMNLLGKKLINGITVVYTTDMSPLKQITSVVSNIDIFPFGQSI